jgi:hypothetical protein
LNQVTLSALRESSRLVAALSLPLAPRSNDPYEVNEPVTPTLNQRWQQQHLLRRTHIEATSAGISPSPPRVRFAQQQARSELTRDFEDDLASSTPLASSSQHISPESLRRPHRAVRISKNTSSAILYALEEALRHPHPFTSDLVEENASMSDLPSGRPSSSAENGRGNGRTHAPPGTTGSPSIRGPRDIMRDREARERRRAEEAEQEALERRRAVDEARLAEEERRQSAERRAAATAAGATGQQRGSGEGANQRGSGGTIGQRISDNSQRSDRRSAGRGGDQPLQGVGRGGHAIGGGDAAPSSRPRPSQAQNRPALPEISQAGPNQQQAAPAPSNDPLSQPARVEPTRSSFPHAFERWETLSAHWEGLTSFWIRRLEENSNEINRDPLSQQLSRQVTDLSAAGANLFHAVVELQRLRASSERKFQRWFFDTRAELEAMQEITATTHESLEEERAARKVATDKLALYEREQNNKDKKLAEMTRELHISKEEARRAWEELGRREEEERERTNSLRDGQPTLVGGVQVVPMMQGYPSRQGSTREQPATREGPVESDQTAPSPEGPVESDTAYQQYSRAQRADPTDPFVETQRSSLSASAQAGRVNAGSSPQSYSPHYTQAPAVQPASTTAFYQQNQGTAFVTDASRSEHDPLYHSSVPSEGGFSEEEYEIDAHGQFIRDARGNKIRYQAPASDDGTDEYDVTAAREREEAYLQQYGQLPISGVEYGSGLTTSASRPPAPTSRPATTQTEPVDYSGQGYGSGPGWEAVPRHHHPTRLSDVLEEDERSRTSASQVSRRD